jgi:hypothetical protein
VGGADLAPHGRRGVCADPARDSGVQQFAHVSSARRDEQVDVTRRRDGRWVTARLGRRSVYDSELALVFRRILDEVWVPSVALPPGHAERARGMGPDPDDRSSSPRWSEVEHGLLRTDEAALDIEVLPPIRGVEGRADEPRRVLEALGAR